jgi:hypothetical protein
MDDINEQLRKAASSPLDQMTTSVSEIQGCDPEKSYAKIMTSAKGFFSFEAKVVGDNPADISKQVQALADELRDYCNKQNGQSIPEEDTWG